MMSLFGLLKSNGDVTLYQVRGDEVVPTGNAGAGGLRGRDLVLFVPAIDVSAHIVALNARTERDAYRAAPFAIEDDLAQAPEQIHVALGSVSAEGGRNVCAVANETMAEWMDRLEALGIQDADLIVPQSILGPENCIVRGPEMTFGHVDGRFFALDAEMPDIVLAGLLQGRGDAEHVDVSRDERVYLSYLILALRKGDAISLRQGAYAVKRSMGSSALKHWRLAGGLAAALALFWVGSQVWSVRNTRALVADMNSRAGDVAKAGWPEYDGNIDRALGDIRAQGGATGGVFPSALQATAALYQAIATIEGSELRSLRYDRSRRQVLAIVAYPAFGDGDKLADAFQQSGLRARVGDARQSGRQVIAELVLEVAA